MREYVLHQAQSRQAYGRLTTLVRVVKNWRTGVPCANWTSLTTIMSAGHRPAHGDDLREMRRHAPDHGRAVGSRPVCG